MAPAEVARDAQREGLMTRMTTFYHDVVAEMKKVTWPDRAQLIDVTIKIIIFVLFIGAIIALLDVALQQILVRWIPALFSGS